MGCLFDVERPHADSSQSIAHGLACKFGSIIQTDVFRCASLREQVREHDQHVVVLELSLHVDGEAFSRVLVDHGEHAEHGTVMSPVGDEVVRPDVAFMLRPESNAGAVIEP